MTINELGNVGLGAPTSESLLHLQGIGFAEVLRLYGTGTGATTATYMIFEEDGNPIAQMGSAREAGIFKIQRSGTKDHAGFIASADFVIDASGDITMGGALNVTGCVADGTCEIMKNENALGIIDDILKTGSGKKDEYDHERMDMKKIHSKYPFMIHEQKTEDEEGKEKKEYFDKLGAKSDLLYVAIGQLNEKIEALEEEIRLLK